MAERSDASEKQLEEIVAYLDGELSAEESAHVERQLASNEAYRQQLQSVERAWAALDELPLAALDDRFARTTMELAVQAAAEEVRERTQALPIARRGHWLATALATAAAAALGFLVFRLAWQDPNAMLLADLPVIDNVDIYAQVEEVGFLRSLKDELGAELEQLGGASSDFDARKQRLETVASAEGREDWLRHLSDEERINLRTRFHRFRDLPRSEQERLRKLHAEISSAPNAAELQDAMLLYHEWLGGLPPARQFDLREMPPDQRARTVKDWAAKMRDDALLTLSEAELKAFAQKVRGPLEKLKRAAARNILQAEGRRPGRGGTPQGPNLAQVRMSMAAQFARGVGPGGEFRSAVVEALPERARATFEQLPPRQKVDRFLTWMRQAEALRGEISQEELERFFAEDLDAQTRAELLSLPPSDMQQALKRRYRRQTDWGFGGPGPGGRREGRDLPGDWRGPDMRGPDRGAPPEGFGPARGFGPPPDRGFGPADERPRPGPPGRRGPEGPPPRGEEFERGRGPESRPGPPP